ncbi:MAG: HAMP domain-containing histidine kinase [Lawsonibacter sp.]|nr:HAMP domain-containing histidine kinase [Lawsonibacter sp.]
MKTTYRRQLAMMVGVIALSFCMLGTAFMLLSYRYIISEKRVAMQRNANDIAALATDYISSVWGGDIHSNAFQGAIAVVAKASDTYVVVADVSGRITYATDGYQLFTYESTFLPSGVVEQLLAEGSYIGMTNLDGIYPERRYLAAQPYFIRLGTQSLAQGFILVSADTSSVSELWSAIATIFFFTAVVVVLIACIASSLTSAYQSRPLNEMAEAARKFGQGEFDVRVTGYENRLDEIGALANAFNSMANSLAKVESQRSDFIANVSHELKTPMTTISGFAEGILDGTIPPERERESLEIIVSETRRLSRLVRRMLELSRLKALTENVTAQEQFDLTEVVSRVLVSLEGKITARSLDVDARLPDGALMVWGDPDAITQVCYNLMDNAAKFAAQGTAITVEISKKDGKALVSISNLGATIPPDELPLLFDRFHKADYSRSVDRDGVGLGLYIVKTVLGNLKENITVTSEDGVTKFTFTLTLA